MKKITLIMKPEMLGGVRERLVEAGIDEISYFEHRSYSSEGQKIWWRGAVPMVQHFTDWIRLEILVKESEIGKALRVLAHFVNNKEVKGYMSNIEELELKELVST